MARLPLIGITTDPPSVPGDRHEVSLRMYAQVVADGGGTPVILPFVREPALYARETDGWLIAGGNDIPPQEYGEEPAPEVRPIAAERYEFEKGLWRPFVETGKPILGICYGCQFINVRCGGSLIQHITPGEVVHGAGLGTYPRHPVALDAASRTAAACGSPAFDAPSAHHQAVKKLGAGLRVTAHAPDGIIEGVEAEGERWVIGVQWHPERAPEDPATRSLFRAFVEAVRAYKHAGK